MSELKVLVTGATGFLGKHLVGALLKDDRVAQVLGVGLSSHRSFWDIDLNESHHTYQECCFNAEHEQGVATLMLRYKPDVVFHLAGNPHVREDEKNPTAITRTNVLSTHNLLAYCKPGARFVLASSAEVYGRQYDARLRTVNEQETVLRPESVYGATKVAAEALAEAYGRNGRVSPLLLRFANVVGRGKNYGILHDLLEKLKSDSPDLPLMSNTLRQYVHVDDAVAATVEFGLDPTRTGPLNLAASNMLYAGFVAELAMEATGISKPIRWLGGDSYDLAYMDNGLLHFYGWKPKFRSSADAVVEALKDLQ